MVLSIAAFVRWPAAVPAGRFAGFATVVATARGLAHMAPARGEDFPAQDVLQECQPLYQALSGRANLDLRMAVQVAARPLQQYPKCGYVFAGILRTRGLLDVEGGAQEAHKALTLSRGYLLPGNQGYDLFLKEAIRSGMAPQMSIGPWRSEIAANLGELKNQTSDYEGFLNQIFAACMQFVRDPFGRESCSEQEFMPEELRNGIANARNKRDRLDQDCAPNYLDNSSGVERCEKAIANALYANQTASLERNKQGVRDAKD